MPKKSTLYVMLISFTAALAGLLFGLDTAIISGALKFISHDFQLQHKTYMQEYIVSAVLFGAIFGTIWAGWLSKLIGRKLVLMFAGIVFAVGSLLSASAHSAEMLIIYRVILGLSVGMAVLITPIYLSEMAPKERRGGVITMYQVMVYVGILLAFIIDTYFSYTASWRWMLGIIAIPAVVMAVLISCLPRSPRWLVMVNYSDKARAVLKKIREHQSEVKAELKEIKDAVAIKQSGWHLFFTSKIFRRVIVLGIILQFMQQFTGINMVLYYAPKVLSLAGLATTAQQMWATIAIGIVNVIACAASIYLVDRWGRKPLMYAGFWGMSISLFGLALMYYLGPAHGFAIQLLAIIFIMLFLITFAFSAGPIVWILCAEIFPLNARDFSMVTAVLTNWICNFILALTFLSVLNGAGPVFTFGGFAVINLIGVALIFWLLPETKGVSLEKIEQNLLKGKRLRDLGEQV